MDWLDRMNSAIKFIEDNLSEETDYEKIAEIACCSVYHFQRMFSFITDIPLSEYIRRRRLTLAAFELQNSDIRLIDLAVKCGYDSADSFSRAFQKVHGVIPSLARDRGVQLKAYPRISFQISIKGDVEMNYRIEDAKALKVFGKSIDVGYHDIKQYEDIKDFVDRSISNGEVQSMLGVIGYGPFEDITEKPVLGEKSEKPDGGLFVFYGHNDYSFKFMIAYDYPDLGVPNDFEVLEIPEATWAVFSMTGKNNSNDDLDTITNIWKRLGEWFLVSDYEHRAGIPELEKRFRTKDGYLAEVWIPILKK